MGGHYWVVAFYRRFLVLTTAKKMKFSIKDFFSKCNQICSFPADLDPFTEEILNGKLHFLRSVTKLLAFKNAHTSGNACYLGSLILQISGNSREYISLCLKKQGPDFTLGFEKNTGYLFYRASAGN